VETTTWEEGLRKTIDWYLKTNCEEYWQGDLEAALRPHPLLVGTSLTGDPARLAL
jgi:UDP-glucose 4,6-dehydratase